MLLHDIKELLIKDYQESNNKVVYIDLIKNNFPLDYSQFDFKIKEQYNIGEINQKEIYRQQIEYAFTNISKFFKEDLIIYKDYMYLCSKIKRNIIQINKKYPLKNIILLENENNIIECIIIDREKEEKIEITIKFKNEKMKNEAFDFINNKIELSKKSNSNKFYKYIFKLLKHESNKNISNRYNTEK